jgi:hypothetical protein
LQQPVSQVRILKSDTEIRHWNQILSGAPDSL